MTPLSCIPTLLAQVLRPDGAMRLMRDLFEEYLLVRQHNRGGSGGRGRGRGACGGSRLSGGGFGRGASRCAAGSIAGLRVGRRRCQPDAAEGSHVWMLLILAR